MLLCSVSQFIDVYAKYNHAACLYTECCYADVVMLNVIVLSVVVPSLLHLPKLLNLFKHFFQSGVKVKNKY
jgi:hypothetical protein